MWCGPCTLIHESETSVIYSLILYVYTLSSLKNLYVIVHLFTYSTSTMHVPRNIKAHSRGLELTVYLGALDRAWGSASGEEHYLNPLLRASAFAGGGLPDHVTTGGVLCCMPQTSTG